MNRIFRAWFSARPARRSTFIPLTDSDTRPSGLFANRRKLLT
jgi:hypothetical protein